MDFVFSTRFIVGFVAGLIACAVIHRYALPMPTTVNGDGG